MITNLGFTNYRSYDQTSFPLQPINLLIGSVAAGKSNIFKGLLLLQNSVSRSLEELFPPGFSNFDSVKSRWTDQTAPIRIEVELKELVDVPDSTGIYKLAIADSPNGLHVLEESLEYSTPGQINRWAFQRGMEHQIIPNFGEVDRNDPTLLNRVFHNDARIDLTSEGVAFTKQVALALSHFSYHHLSASQLKSPGNGHTAERIGYYGNGLPDFLAWVRFGLGNPLASIQILDAMQELIPELDKIIVTQGRSDEQGLAMTFKGQRGYIAATDLSDGTLLTLGLLCLIHSPIRPNLLCIEEPETGLNPRRLRWLFEQFINMAYPSDGTKATQVIFSTHSPGLVDLFGKNMQDSVLLVEQDQGRSRIKPLVEVQRERLHQEPDPSDPIGHLWATGVYEGL